MVYSLTKGHSEPTPSWHEADEMTDAARRFQNVAAIETKSSLAFLWQSVKPSSVLF